MARILIVEDQLAARVLLRSVLVRAGHQTVLAENGEDALGYLRTDPAIDIVVTDLDMPKMNGVELLSQLAALSRRIATVVVTVYTEHERSLWADSLRDVDVVEKPLDGPIFLQTVDRVLGVQPSRV